MTLFDFFMNTTFIVNCHRFQNYHVFGIPFASAYRRLGSALAFVTSYRAFDVPLCRFD